MQPAFDDLRDRLAAISEEMGDLSLQILREALEKGATERPDVDRRLGRARSAVDKAVHLLDGAGADSQSDD